jgi:integrase
LDTFHEGPATAFRTGADRQLVVEDSPTKNLTEAPLHGLLGMRLSSTVPAALCNELAALTVSKGRDDLVFTGQRGGVLRNSNWRARVFRPSVAKCQAADETFPTITPHALRHTAASLAVSAHANVKAVQRMLGHAKASMTLDIYADLFDEDLDGVADRLDAAIQATADALRTVSEA